MKLIRADNQRVPLLGLRVERPRAGKAQRVTLRFEWPFIRRQQRVTASDRRVELHDVTIRCLVPSANVFDAELDIEIFIRQFDFE